MLKLNNDKNRICDTSIEQIDQLIMGEEDSNDNNLDVVFTEIGEFGIFQVFTFALICIPNIMFATYVVNYIFATNTLDYRCKVPECDVGDNNRMISYDQPWLSNAIPKTSNGFENCVRFAPINVTTPYGHQCTADLFNTTKQIACTEFVYTTDETNVQTEFNIHCEDSYKLALIGSANNIGRLLFLPLTGILSDKFGRLRVVVIGLMACSIFGLIKSFAVSYWMYIAFEFLEASAGTCTFSGIYVLGMEYVSSKYRALATSLIVTSYPIGEVLLGIIAIYIHNFRYLLRVLYTPGLLIIFYFWLVPESFRWLLITGRVDRAVKVLQRIAKTNGKTLSDKSIEMLHLQYSKEAMYKAHEAEEKAKMSLFQQIRMVFGSRKLGLRLLNNCYKWITCCFCYYGLSLISTHIPGVNRYTSYIIVQAVEIPGALLPVLLLNRFGRKKLLFTSLLISGVAAICAPWVPAERYGIILLLSMIGKSSITFAFSVLYIFTAELWPTNLRTTIMNLCSMTGRMGGALAPLTILLIVKMPFMPYMLFGSTAIVAAVMVLLCPETYAKKLPDSVEEAKDL